MTVNGKLDRSALPAPVLDDTGRAAGTERERVLSEVHAEVLGLARVGVDADFFSRRPHTPLTSPDSPVAGRFSTAT